MTFIKEKIDFIYQNILLFHFKALSLRTLNERLKNTPNLQQSLLTLHSSPHLTSYLITLKVLS